MCLKKLKIGTKKVKTTFSFTGMEYRIFEIHCDRRPRSGRCYLFLRPSAKPAGYLETINYNSAILMQKIIHTTAFVDDLVLNQNPAAQSGNITRKTNIRRADSDHRCWLAPVGLFRRRAA